MTARIDPRESARSAAARLALRHLAAARAAGRRLRDEDDAEALHDVRVALRRLRSVLRAYAPHLKRPGLEKLRRRLRALARATAPARDAEVQLAWLAALEPASRPERTARRWLAARLRARHRVAHEAMAAELRAGLSAVEKALRPRLAAQRPGPRDVPYGEATATLLLEHARALKARLKAVRGVADREALHRARIAGKRLRYLLEPLVDIDADARAALDQLEAFQDRLGALNDLYVRTDALREAAGRAAGEWGEAVVRALGRPGGDRAAVAEPEVLVGLFALAGATRREIAAEYGLVRRRYLASSAWLAPVGRLAARLRGGAETLESVKA